MLDSVQLTGTGNSVVQLSGSKYSSMSAREVVLSADQTKTIGGNSYLYLGAIGRSLPDNIQLTGTGNSVVQLSGDKYSAMRARTVALSTDQTSRPLGGNPYLYLGATGRSLPDDIRVTGTGNRVI